jgi:hypothetical protein
MKKKYIIPAVKQFSIVTEGVMQDVFSGGGTQQGDPTVNPDPDDSEDDNLSKSFNFSIWDEDPNENTDSYE